MSVPQPGDWPRVQALRASAYPHKGIAYLASPYSHPSAEVRERRYRVAVLTAARLMREGRLVYSPIVHNHPIAVAATMPTDWDFWQRHDLALLHLSVEFLICTLDGWQQSNGLAAEWREARQLGLPIEYVRPEEC